jgi:hypothetical protein
MWKEAISRVSLPGALVMALLSEYQVARAYLCFAICPVTSRNRQSFMFFKILTDNGGKTCGIPNTIPDYTQFFFTNLTAFTGELHLDTDQETNNSPRVRGSRGGLRLFLIWNLPSLPPINLLKYCVRCGHSFQ